VRTAQALGSVTALGRASVGGSRQRPGRQAAGAREEFCNLEEQERHHRLPALILLLTSESPTKLPAHYCFDFVSQSPVVVIAQTAACRPSSSLV
jgi:hypothetical protein